MTIDQMSAELSTAYGKDVMRAFLEDGVNRGFPKEEVYDGLRYALGIRFSNNELFTAEELSVMIGKSLDDTKKLIHEVQQGLKVRFL